ncbi:hypothetical protein N657DRAFT_318944 [Parathielavia appendiculata]|uniref:Zn(2)-C6 fungal-type domain-containing protein n=1 Tax=Parathielavia appendiculata TaxID=2587402 RepID=A0AAN6TR48_9PEZI|nr:hypothetical protein N657DRAFT_318944 [Parathielavia appendiculata]
MQAKTTSPKFLVLMVSGSSPKVKEYKRRRHHTKDRLGCLFCRQKRVKCDRGKPVCARCGRSGVACRYETSYSAPVSSSSSQSLSTPLSALPTVLVNSILQPRLLHTAGPNAARQLPIQALLHHAAAQGDILGMPLTPPFWDLACRHPHLLATVLALAACRLRGLAPHGDRSYSVAECALKAVALGDFQPALAEPLTQSKSDALLFTSMLLNNLAFASLADDDKNDGYPWCGVSFAPSFLDDTSRQSSDSITGCTNPHTNRSHGLEWLALGMGLKPLLMATQAFRGAYSALTPIFAASDDESETFSRSHEDLEGAPAHWVRLVSSTRTSSVASAGKEWCLREPLGTLAAARALTPAPENGLKYSQFVGKLEPAFMELLCDRDERAMWMLGYWLGLIGRLGAWWSGGRVRRDGAAIRLCLLAKGVCERQGEEGEMWRRLMQDYDCVYSTMLA